MKTLKIIFFTFLLSIFNFSFALNAPQNIKLEKAGENFLEISWDKVDGAGIYSISYGEKSIEGTQNTYEHEEEIIVESNSGKIDNLKENTEYYIAIKAYDENEESSDFSKEVKFKTIQTNQESIIGLKITNIDIIDFKTLNLSFNTELKEDGFVDLSITNKDSNESISVENYDINGKNLIVHLKNKLEENTSYNIIIIAIEGKNGETINAGVNGTINFTSSTQETSTQEKQNISNNNVDDNTDNNIELNSAGIKGKQLGGTILNNSTDTKTTEIIAQKEVKKMPQTGPAETILLLIIAFISSGLYFIKRKKL